MPDRAALKTLFHMHNQQCWFEGTRYEKHNNQHLLNQKVAMFDVLTDNGHGKPALFYPTDSIAHDDSNQVNTPGAWIPVVAESIPGDSVAGGHYRFAQQMSYSLPRF
jgi:hypothetical protein